VADYACDGRPCSEWALPFRFALRLRDRRLVRAVDAAVRAGVRDEAQAAAAAAAAAQVTGKGGGT
jgi:hypothetical protein